MRYAYPVTIERDGDAFMASFDGLPGATEGATEAEALARAQELLVTALAALVEDGTAVPAPSDAAGRPLVSVPTMEAAKLALHDAMRAGGVSNVDLARRLGTDEKSVRRLRDPLIRSHIGAVEAALRSLGREVVLEVLEPA